MASPGEIEPRALRFPPNRPRIPVLTLAPVPAPPRRSPGWLDPRSLRAQSVAVFLMFVAFAAYAIVISQVVGNASKATQAQQDQMQQSLTLLASVVAASDKVQLLTQEQGTATAQVVEALERIAEGSAQVSETAQKISTAAGSNVALASEMEARSRSGNRPD